MRHLCLHFSQNHHFGFEAAAWYWHFVDVVWLFLFISIYWWGNYFFSINSILDFQSSGPSYGRNNAGLFYFFSRSFNY
jgi:hypothetical protein